MSICSLYFPEITPIVHAPKEKDSCTDIKYEEKSTVLMYELSVSNVALQYLLDIRDCVLSKDPNEMGGCAKIVIVTILCLTASVGYTVLNVAEASMRGVAGIIGTIIALPLFFIASYCGFAENSRIGLALGWTAVISMFGGLLGALQGTCQVSAGFFAAYKMATDTQPQSLPVGMLVKIASCGIPNQIIDFVSP